MRIIDLLQNNELSLSEKGLRSMIRAFQYVCPDLRALTSDEDIAYLIVYDLPEEDCLKVLQLTVKYANLWAFA